MKAQNKITGLLIGLVLLLLSSCSSEDDPQPNAINKQTTEGDLLELIGATQD